MAAQRRFNYMGQMRYDVPHGRLIEEAIAGDLDALAGQMLAGGSPQILRGFTIIGTTGPASGLSVRVAGGRLMHPTASDSGTVYAVADTEPDELLKGTNPHVEGAFSPNAVNFVGLDLVLETNDATSDTVQFLSTSTGKDDPRTVPLGRLLRRRIVISTLDPATTPGLAPIAKITTDAGNNVASIVDNRNQLCRLARGGGAPNPLYAYAWPAGRTESTDFTSNGGDRQLDSLKTWMDAVMTRMWEVGGGEHWYSAAVDRNATVVGTGTTFVSTGDFFEWVSNNLHWQNLAVIFENATGHINEIKDQATDSSGLTDLADGECIYVDIDRTVDKTGGAAIQAYKTTLNTLGTPIVPGSRWVMAWRRGAQVYTRGRYQPVGSVAIPAATAIQLGTVKISGTAPDPANPIAVITDAASRAMAAGVTRAGTTVGTGAVAIAPNTADTAVTSGHDAMAGGHIFKGNTGSGDLADFRQGGTSIWKLLGQGGQIFPLRAGTPSNPATDTLVFSMRTNGLSTPDRRIQLVVKWPDGTEGVIIESEAS